MITFEYLCDADPQLNALRQEALDIASRVGDDLEAARDHWYGNCQRWGLKARMVHLTGCYAKVPEMAHPLAYNVAYRGLWQAMTGRELN
ncbi:MAG: hypothetical protein EOM66_09985 [Clostridia bacterium]|nr:hypothetical protein [Clostridia bacterium]